jgi:hypothetical protein
VSVRSSAILRSEKVRAPEPVEVITASSDETRSACVEAEPVEISVIC